MASFPQQVDPTFTAAKRYEGLTSFRSPFETRARDCSELTIPSILTRNANVGGTGSDELPSPFQSTGARGVNNLTAKLTLTLFPPGNPFFRLTVDRIDLEELRQAAGEQVDVLQEIEDGLVLMELATMDHFEIKGSRQIVSDSLMNLIVTGNGLLQVLKDGSLKLHRLDHYVCRRDVDGEPFEILFREGVEGATLPPAIRELVKDKIQTNDDATPQKTLWLYTWARKEGNTWKVHQEIEEFKVPDSEWSYPDAKPALIPLRWRGQLGEDYGRGFVEQYLGDLMSLEALTQSIVEFSAVASKIVHFVDEAGLTDKEEIQNAPNGAILDGNANDITTLQLDKFQDFQVAEAVAQRIERRLEQAFLLTSSVQRQAERVTAEEIRLMANELETALGGVYSTLATELQRPLVIRLLSTLAREKRLPQLPEGKVEPQIITGIDGLGRTAELQRLDILLGGVGEIFGQQALAEYTRVGAYIERRAAALGIDVSGVFRGEDEVQQQRQAQQQAEMQKAAAPQAVQQSGAIVQKGMEQAPTEE